MTKLKSSNTIVKLKNTVMSLLILIFVLFISIPPSLAAILPTDSAPHTSNIAVDSNLADALSSVPTSTESEPELDTQFRPIPICGIGCRYDSSRGICVYRLTGRPC
jgi:hypothetical protein